VVMDGIDRLAIRGAVLKATEKIGFLSEKKGQTARRIGLLSHMGPETMCSQLLKGYRFNIKSKCLIFKVIKLFWGGGAAVRDEKLKETASVRAH
jgi:hypothetical protein